MRGKWWLATLLCVGVGDAMADAPREVDVTAAIEGASALGPHAEQEMQFGGVEAVPFFEQDVLSTAGPPRVSRQVLGFLPYWSTSPQIHWDLLTQLIWFCVTANADGSI